MEDFLDREFCQFQLSATDIRERHNLEYTYDAVFDNDIGTLSEGKTYIVFKKLGLREMLGDEFYNKYDTFRLRLISVRSIFRSYTVVETYPLSNDIRPKNRHLELMVSGLPWSFYTAKRNVNTEWASFGTLSNQNRGNFAQNNHFMNQGTEQDVFVSDFYNLFDCFYNGYNGLTFSKVDKFELRIRIQATSDGEKLTSADFPLNNVNQMPHLIFRWMITGVD